MLHNNDQEYLRALSYVKRGKNRKRIVQVIGTDRMMPSEIATITNQRVNQVSGTLTELKNMKIVLCVNEDEFKGRFYVLTDTGLEIYEELKKTKSE